MQSVKISASEWPGQLVRSGVLLAALMATVFVSGISAMAGPFCASCALLALMPKAPFSTPKTLLLSHVICVGAGVLLLSLPFPTLAITFVAAWISIMTMTLLRVVHAPAVAHTVILTLGKQDGESYAVAVLLTALGLTLLAYLMTMQSAAKRLAV